MCEYELPVKMDPEEMMKNYDPHDLVYLYLNEIKSFKPLPPQEEEELAKQLPSDDKQILNKLIASNLTLVISIAKQYTGRGMHILDLIQEGNNGLALALNTFDPEKEISFSRHLEQCIRNHIQRELKHIILDISHIPEAITIHQQNRTTTPVEHQDKEDEIDILPEDMFVCDDQSADSLQEILDSMSPREAAVIRMRLGLDGGAPKTQEETAQAFGVTRERIRQIESKFIRRISRGKRRKHIRDFYT